jgi:hypothetical protein
MTKQVFPLNHVGYERHLIHTRERHWAETNCYVDVWIELLHAWGFDPLAAMPFTVALDFEGDQWTFFKFPHADLRDLYGLEVQELAIWRPLVKHVEEQVGMGRPVLVELDSYYLPDTEGTAYRREHTKSTVAIIQIDVDAQRLGYFHGQGYYELQGEDFVQVFRLAGPIDPAMLPPYVEIVKRRPSREVTRQRLARTSFSLLKRQLALIPESNPFVKFKPRFEADLQWLTQESLEVFHQYSFATLRQFGACYEMAALYLDWLEERGITGLNPARDAFNMLSTGAKTLQFQLARAMARKKPLSLTPLDDLAVAWQTAMDFLKSRVEIERTSDGDEHELASACAGADA